MLTKPSTGYAVAVGPSRAPHGYPVGPVELVGGATAMLTSTVDPRTSGPDGSMLRTVPGGYRS